MTITLIALFLGMLGAAMGSFAGAVAWRLHKKRNFVSDRSECESCHHKLGPLDLIPIVSWLLLGGCCRYCKAGIGVGLLITELMLATLFVISYLAWPYDFNLWQGATLFGLWLLTLVLLAILVIYDARWMLLPDVIVYPLIALGFVNGILIASLQQPGFVGTIMYLGLGVLALAGVYGALFVVSHGRWIGFGDVKLSVFIGATLGWQKALLVLFLANIIGFLIVFPGLASGKLTRTSRVPFGPFLIVAFVIAGLFGDDLIRGYLRFIGL